MSEWINKAKMKYCKEIMFSLFIVILIISPSGFPLRDVLGTTNIVSVSSSGAQGSDWSGRPAISSNGRYVAFVSTAINLVVNDTNGAMDIFVHDRETNQSVRISEATDGTEANNDSDEPSISADGRYVVFVSSASNLYENDTNGQYDVFVMDRDTDNDGIFDEPDSVNTVRVFDSPSQTANISENGVYIVAPAAVWINGKLCAIPIYNQVNQQYVCGYETYNGAPLNGNRGNISLSSEGEFVAFTSDASNLVPNDTNGKVDVFVYDLLNHQTTRVSVSSSGEQSNGDSDKPVISANGQYVAFASLASNLIVGDTFGYWDVFIHNMLTGETSRISVAQDGSQAFNHSDAPSISANGRYIAFESLAANIVVGDANLYNDIFLHDNLTGENFLISVAEDGFSSNGWSNCYTGKIVSGDGLTIVFQSDATNLVDVDQNGKLDVFVREITFQYKLYLPFMEQNRIYW